MEQVYLFCKLKAVKMAQEKPCDCHDEKHSEKDRKKHKHVGDQCIHQDGTRHKIHSK